MNTSPAFLTQERLGTILSLATPIIIGLGSQTLLNLVDTAMVGKLGTEVLAAVGLASMFIWVVSSLVQGLSPAVQAVTARRQGELNLARLDEALINSLYLVFLLGIPYTWFMLKGIPWIFSWLSDDASVRLISGEYAFLRLIAILPISLNFCFLGYFNGRSKSMLYLQTLVLQHLLNILLNYLLIFGKFGFPELGYRGAAIGSAVATCLGTLNYVRLFLKNRGAPTTGIRWVIQRRLLIIALPSCVQYLTMSVGFLLFFRIAAMISTQALAATNVLVQLALVCILLSRGLGLSTITLVGKALGEARPDEAKRWVWAILVLGCAVVGLAGLLMSLAPQFLLRGFITDPAVIQAAIPPLIILGLSQVFDAAYMILSHAHMGGGATKRVMTISVVNQWLLFLPACYLWITLFNGQLVHLWICYVVYRLLLFVSIAISTRDGRWLSMPL